MEPLYHCQFPGWDATLFMQNVTVLGNYERTFCNFLQPWVNLPLSQNTKLKTLVFLIKDLVHSHVHRKSWIYTQPREMFPLEMNTEIVAPLLSAAFPK